MKYLCAIAAIAVVMAGGTDPMEEAAVLFNKGDIARAAARFEAAVKANPKDPAARLALGVALSSARRYDEAAAQFRRAGELMPESVVPPLLTEGALREKEKDAQMKGRVAKSTTMIGITRAPAVAAATVPIQAVNGSLKLLTDAVIRYPRNAIFHSLLGDVYQMIGRYEEAMAQYREATDLAPTWVKPRLNLGLANLQIDPVQAAKDLEEVLRLDPSNAQARLYLGDAYAYQNRYAEAKREYRAAQGDPSLAAAARVRLGNVLLKENQPREAEKEFQQAAKAAPSAPEVRAGIGEALIRQRRFEQGARELEKAAELSTAQTPPSAQAALRSRAADAYVQGGQIGKAERVLVSNLGLPEADPFPRIVELQDKSGRLDQEIAAKEKALIPQPKDVQALKFLLAAYEYRKKHLQALEILGRLLIAAPAESARWYLEMGKEYLALGRKPDAIEAWKKGLGTRSERYAEQIIREARSGGLLAEIESYYVGRRQNRPDDVAARQILAGIYESTDRLQDAIAIREELVRLVPESQSEWMMLAATYERLGQREKAALAYDRASAVGDSIGLRSLARQKAKELREGK